MRHLMASTAMMLVLASSTGWAAGVAGNTEPSNPTPANSASQAAAAQPQQPATINVMAANQIVGRTLKDSQGSDAGQVNSLIIDTKNGAVDFVLIGSSGSFDLRGQLVAVPWSALRTPGGGTGPIALQVSVDQLQKAPRVNPRLIYELRQPELQQRIYGYYGPGYAPYYGYLPGYLPGLAGAYRGLPPRPSEVGAADHGAIVNAVPAGQVAANQNDQTGSATAANPRAGQDGQDWQAGRSTLLIAQNGSVATLEKPKTTSSDALQNATVYAPNGDDVGDIDEVLIDVDRGEVAYVLLSRGGFLGIGQSWSALPVEALSRAPYQDGYRLTVDEQVLNKEPALHIDRQNMPSRVSTAQLATLYGHFGIRPYWRQGSHHSDKNAQAARSQSQ